MKSWFYAFGHQGKRKYWKINVDLLVQHVASWWEMISIHCLLGKFPVVNQFNVVFKWNMKHEEVVVPSFPRWQAHFSGFNSSSAAQNMCLPQECRAPACLPTWSFPKTFSCDSLWYGEFCSPCFIIICCIVFIEFRIQVVWGWDQDLGICK